MNRTFDYLGNIELPDFILCNPNGKQIAVMSHAKNRLLKKRIGGFSELTFDVDKEIDGVTVPYYNMIEGRREVLVDGYGLFIIESFDEFNDGLRCYKSVTCKSKDAEFATKSLVAYKGSKKLFSRASNDTILGKLIEYFPKWKVEYVSSTLYEEERMYDVSEQNWYDFLMTNVQEDFSCVFVFDTIKKSIRVLDMTELRKKTDIYVSFENLLKSISINPPTQNVVTAMDVYGGDGLDISTVNLTGNTLYNYSHYKHTDWINQDTIDAITRWENKIATDNVSFTQKFTALKVATGELITLQVQLAELNSQLKSLNDIKGVRISQGLSYSDIESQIVTKEAEITSKETAIINKKANIDTLKTQMKALQNGVKQEVFFTESQLKDLDSITFKSVYQNDCFIKSSIMTDQEVQEQSEKLMKLAKDILDTRLSKLCYTFTSEMINFTALKEFEPFTKQLELGAEFTLDVGGDVFNPILLEMDIAFDDIKASTFMFCTDMRKSTDGLDFANLFNGFRATLNDIDYNKGLMKDYVESGDKSNFDSMKNDALNLTLKDIIASDGQDFVISSYGIRGKREGSKNEVWMTNNCLAFSNNNFKPDSAKLALGEVTIEGVKAFGLIADVLIGDFIASKTLKITNTNSTILINDKGLDATNASITLNKADGNSKILLNPNDGIKIQSKLNNVMTDVLFLDVDGNLNFKGNLTGATGTFSGRVSGAEILGGTLNIGNGTFTVDASGYCEARNIKVVGGQIQGGSLLGTSISINDKFAVNSQGVCTATDIIITGNGNGKRALMSDIWISGGAIEQISSSGEGFLLSEGYMFIHGENSVLAGSIYQIKENNITKMLVQGMNALKLYCQSGSVSVGAAPNNKVYIESDCVFSGSVVDKNGNPIGGVATFG